MNEVTTFAADERQGRPGIVSAALFLMVVHIVLCLVSAVLVPVCYEDMIDFSSSAEKAGALGGAIGGFLGTLAACGCDVLFCVKMAARRAWARTVFVILSWIGIGCYPLSLLPMLSPKAHWLGVHWLGLLNTVLLLVLVLMLSSPSSMRWFTRRPAA